MQGCIQQVLRDVLDIGTKGLRKLHSKWPICWRGLVQFIDSGIDLPQKLRIKELGICELPIKQFTDLPINLGKQLGVQQLTVREIQLWMLVGRLPNLRGVQSRVSLLSNFTHLALQNGAKILKKMFRPQEEWKMAGKLACLGSLLQNGGKIGLLRQFTAKWWEYWPA